MNRSLSIAIAAVLSLSVGFALAVEPPSRGEPWPIHVIDNSSRGADGVRLADVNGDGLPDFTTGWEEGGITRVYVNPGPAKATGTWPAVTVGRTPNVEDAVLVDLDEDGRTDVVSCCEGGTQTVFVHWAPKDPDKYLNADAWTTAPLPASEKKTAWMFCLPMQIDGRHGVDLVAGAKAGGAVIGWFEAPEDPRDLDAWRWHPISPAGWIMSLRGIDIDGDGDRDVLVSDRRGALRGCRWLENPGPGPAQAEPWKNHFIGGQDREAMFLTLGDLVGDGADEVLLAVKPAPLVWFARGDGPAADWTTHTIDLPQRIGTGKGVGIGDINLDGRSDVVLSCENSGGGASGVIWLSHNGDPQQTDWTPHEISGPVGIKYDRIELLDLDADGDLDLLTCEESEPVDGKRWGLGVFWYENPAVSPYR